MKPYKTEAALVAARIRADLKAKFPKTKFAVHSKTYSGGDSVSVKWNFGPKTEAVKDVISHYEAGYFDGMDDCYHYTHDSHEVTPEGKIVETPTVKFVFEDRSFNLANGESAFFESVKSVIASRFHSPEDGMRAAQDLVWRVLANTDFTETTPEAFLVFLETASTEILNQH